MQAPRATIDDDLTPSISGDSAHVSTEALSEGRTPKFPHRRVDAVNPSGALIPDADECRSTFIPNANNELEAKLNLAQHSDLPDNAIIATSTCAPWNNAQSFNEKPRYEIVVSNNHELNRLALCGIGFYRPHWLQKWATKRGILFWLCWFCAVQGMLVNGLVPSVLSTVESRFGFTGVTLGRITQFYDVGYVLCCIPVSYFGGRHSKPIYLGVGILIMGMGSFLFAMPHMASETYQHRDLTKETAGSCVRTANAVMLHNCTVEEGNSPFPRVYDNWRYELMFCLAHLLHGIGATPLFTLGVSYLDENIKPALSSMYIAVFYTFAIFGPAAGFLLSSAFLRYHTHSFNSERPTDVLGIDESDPNWIGMWWMGFLITSIIAFIGVVPIFSFPRVLPAALPWYKARVRSDFLNDRHQRRRNIDEMHMAVTTNDGLNSASTNSTGTTVPLVSTREAKQKLTRKDSLRDTFMTDIQAIPITVKRLLCNAPYMCLTMAAAVDGILITGFSTFMAKYLEGQFSVASSKANMLIGSIMVPAAGVGTLASGYLIKRFRLSASKTIKFCICMCVMSLVLTPMFLVYCIPIQLVGVEKYYPGEHPYTNGSATLIPPPPNLTGATCHRHCTCSDKYFRPVCGHVDGEAFTFFSSCLAGCPEEFHPAIKNYHNCTCALGGTTTRGVCESDCAYLKVFLVLFAPMVLFTFAIGIPALSVILRCVEHSERSFALGIQWILIRCIGTIPSPALFGWLFDLACQMRSTDPCSAKSGKCHIYDNTLLSNLFLLVGIIGQSGTLLFLVLALIMYKRRQRSHSVKEEPFE